MSNALYFSTGSVSPEEYFHYGLALDRYTHFTSPIRRYADVIVSGTLSHVTNLLIDQVRDARSLPKISHDVESFSGSVRNTQNRSRKCSFWKSARISKIVYSDISSTCEIQSIAYSLIVFKCLSFEFISSPQSLCRSIGYSWLLWELVTKSVY